MKATELELGEVVYGNTTFNFSANVYPAKSHYKSIMRMGRVMPTTKAQAMYFVKNGCALGVLNKKDVADVEALLNKHGFEGDYQYTKSKSWARLISNNLSKALRLEFGF